MKNIVVFLFSTFLFNTSCFSQFITLTTAQVNNPIVAPGQLNQAIIQIVIEVGVDSSVIQDFTFNTVGCSNPPTDVINARLWYTDTIDTLDVNSAIPVGVVALPWFTNYIFFAGPATFKIPPGFSNFWITYDIQVGSSFCDTIDAGLVGLYFDNIWYNPTLAISNPAGFSTIGTPCITGLNEHESKLNYTTYPNPASTDITFEFEQPFSNETTIEIQNSLGKKVAKHFFNFSQNIITISTNELPSGIYFYSISEHNSEIGRGKFVVEN